MENLFKFENTEFCPHCNTGLRPGAFVTLVPYGALVTVQYSAEGHIEKIYFGAHDCGIDVTSSYLNTFVVGGLVPTNIPLTGGTSWVTGVVTIPTLVEAEGQIPYNINVSVMDNDYSDMKFSAAYIVSNALGFNNLKAMEHVLKTYGFNLLPSWMVPFGGLTQEVLDNWMKADTWQYPVQLVMYYIQYIDGNRTWYCTGLHQDILTDAEVLANEADGEVRLKITYGDDEYPESTFIPVSDAVKFKIAGDTMLVRDSVQQILMSAFDESKRTFVVTDEYYCRCCGKKTKVPTSGPLYCSNAHCGTRMVERVKLMLNTFNLPIGYSDVEWFDMFTNKSAKHKLTCLTDVFTLDAYANIDVHIPLYKLLRALVPVSLIRNSDVFIQFANKCNNNLTTFQYYINNFERAAFDLNFTHPDAAKLDCWLGDSMNASDVAAMLMLPNLHIDETEHSFDGPPIFRNMKLCLTGRFKRGSFEDMINFLQSYSASVSTEYVPGTSYVLLGSLHDSIDGTIVGRAKADGVPVVDEDLWFEQFDLDSDLKNLQ